MVKLNIINFDKLASKSKSEIKYKNKHPMLPQHPFRLLINGSSGSGKTNLLMNMILRWLYFDKLYVFSKHLEQPKYVKIQEFFDDVAEKTGESILETGNDIEDIVSIDDLDDTQQNLIIIDDFVTEKNQKCIADLFVRGRHKNASVIYISQSYFRTPRDIRLNCSYFVFYSLNQNKKELSLIYNDLGSDIEKDVFIKMALAATNVKFDFFLIDKTTEYKKLRYRQNFDSLYFD